MHYKSFMLELDDYADDLQLSTSVPLLSDYPQHQSIDAIYTLRHQNKFILDLISVMSRIHKLQVKLLYH